MNQARDVVQEAYTRLGYQVEFKYLAPQRSLEMVNIGVFDGTAARIEGAEQKFANMIRIPVSVTNITGVVFTKYIERDIHTWKDLEGLKIGIIKGVLYSEKGTQGMNTVYAKDMRT